MNGFGIPEMICNRELDSPVGELNSNHIRISFANIVNAQKELEKKRRYADRKLEKPQSHTNARFTCRTHWET
jgi:hypothetical protein